MKILGIESSCDETAASVVEDGRKVLSSVVASQVDTHKIYGGVVPEIASRSHIEAISGVVKEALNNANTSIDDIDAIGVTYAPGLIGALLVGVNFAKGLAFASKKPLIPTHHIRSHVASNYITSPDLKPPFLALIVSGGHSHIVMVNDYTDFEILAKTHDDAAGETFDKIARTIGLPYPGGIELDKLAEGGDETAFKLPRPRIDDAPLDFSFSGLKTAVINIVHNANQKNEEIKKADLAASVRFTVADILTKSLFTIADDLKSDKIVLAGGVSANSLLRKMTKEKCDKRGIKLYLPDLKYCGDNAAMVASQSYYEFLNGNVADESLNAYAGMPIDKIFK
jgi:N6-L-threonylcarbamoyladenine synthase